jgi:hypothetical protein
MRSGWYDTSLQHQKLLAAALCSLIRHCGNESVCHDFRGVTLPRYDGGQKIEIPLSFHADHQDLPELRKRHSGR